MGLTLRLKRTDSTYVTKPMVTLKILPPTEGDEVIATIAALIDTGADVSFLVAGSHPLKHGQFSQKNQGERILRIQIDDLVKQTRLLFLERAFTNHNPNDIAPQALLGRDFLKQVKMNYDGPNDTVVLEWHGV